MHRFISKNKTLLSIIMLLLLVFGLIGFIMFFSQKTFPSIEKGSYKIINQEVQVREQVSKLLLADDKLVLFYENEGYAAIYTKNGDFLYGIQVDTSDKGTGNTSYLDGCLVIKSKANTVYFFNGSLLVNSFHIGADQNQYKSLMDRMGNYRSLTFTVDGTTFSISNGKIVKTDSSGISTILSPLPKKTMNPVFLISFFLGVVLLLFVQKTEH